MLKFTDFFAKNCFYCTRRASLFLTLSFDDARVGGVSQVSPKSFTTRFFATGRKPSERTATIATNWETKKHRLPRAAQGKSHVSSYRKHTIAFQLFHQTSKAEKAHNRQGFSSASFVFMDLHGHHRTVRGRSHQHILVHSNTPWQSDSHYQRSRLRRQYLRYRRDLGR